MQMLKLHDVWKAYGAPARVGVKELLVGKSNVTDRKFLRKWALEDINFSLDAGQSLGIVGLNGTGKSTLLSVMLGTLLVDRGSIVRRGRIGAMLELGSGFHPDLTGRENVFLNASILGVRIREVRAKFDSILEFCELGAAIEQPLRTYSSGMSARLAFAVLAHTHSDVLLIDEVLAVGDASFQRKCVDFLAAYTASGGALVIVSHNTEALKKMCHEGICLGEGRILAHGPIHTILDCYAKICDAGLKEAGKDVGKDVEAS